MKKDDIRTLLVVMIVCLIPIGIVLIANRKNNYEKLEVVTEYNTFFSISNYINTYINHTTNNDSRAIYEILDNKYISENDISTINVFDKIDTYPLNSSIKINSMKYLRIKKNYIYYITGEVFQNNFEELPKSVGNINIIVIIDFDNLSFSIYPVTNKNYKKVINNTKSINIEKNNYNELSNADLITKEKVCIIYLSDYTDKLYNNIEEAYNLLNSNAKQRYSTLDSFSDYINNNSNKITTMADKCLVEDIDKKRVYTVIDSNENKYTFTEESILNYKVDFYLKEE